MARVRVRSMARGLLSSLATTRRSRVADTISRRSPAFRSSSSTTDLGSRTVRPLPHFETRMMPSLGISNRAEQGTGFAPGFKTVFETGLVFWNLSFALPAPPG